MWQVTVRRDLVRLLVQVWKLFRALFHLVNVYPSQILVTGSGPTRSMAGGGGVTDGRKTFVIEVYEVLYKYNDDDSHKDYKRAVM